MSDASAQPTVPSAPENTQTPSQPATARSDGSARAPLAPGATPQSGSFISQVTIDYGPPDLLGPFFLKADAALRAQGVFLSFGTLEELAEANRRNRDSWRPLLPIYSGAQGANPQNSYCLLARNRQGEIVGTQAGRMYSWTNTDFHAEAESLRLFYTDPDRSKNPGEKCVVTAPTARKMYGQVLFSGAVWFRRDYRGRALPMVMSPLSRAYGLTRWWPDVTLSIMAEDVFKGGVASTVGYPDADWTITATNNAMKPDGVLKMALVSARREWFLNELSRLSVGLDSQVDPVVQYRSA